MISKYAIFIISHGRPECVTAKTLQDIGFSGQWYIVVDDTDSDVANYIDNYGKDHIIIFNKKYFIENTDTATADKLYGCGVYARNAVESIAKDKQLDAFLVLDDDITSFVVRYPKDEKLLSYNIQNKLDEALSMCIEFILNNDIATAGLGYNNIYIGGFNKDEQSQPTRLLANSFIRNSKFSVDWVGQCFDDFITGIVNQRRGQFWTVLPIIQIRTSDPPGNTEQSGGNHLINAMETYDRISICKVFLPDCYRYRLLNNKLYCSPVFNLSLPKLVTN